MMIVTSVSGNLEEARKEAKRALSMGSDIVEFRMDLIWDSPPDLERVRDLIEGMEGRTLLTWRTERHGGRGSEPSHEYLESLARISRLVDVEFELAMRGLRIANAIYSWHDPSGTPDMDVLLRISNRLLSAGGLAKVVTLAMDELEAYRVLNLYKRVDHRGRLVAFSMGEKASFSRRMAALLGSPLIYSFLGEAAAPGQLTLKEALLIKELLS